MNVFCYILYAEMHDRVGDKSSGMGGYVWSRVCAGEQRRIHSDNSEAEEDGFRR